jgi:hypothetical protein
MFLSIAAVEKEQKDKLKYQKNQDFKVGYKEILLIIYTFLYDWLHSL